VQGRRRGVPCCRLRPFGIPCRRIEFPTERIAGAVGVLALHFAAPVGGVGLGIRCLPFPIVTRSDTRGLCSLAADDPQPWRGGPARPVVFFVSPESPIRTGPGRLSLLAPANTAGPRGSVPPALLVPLSEAPTWGWVSAKTLGSWFWPPYGGLWLNQPGSWADGPGRRPLPDRHADDASGRPPLDHETGPRCCWAGMYANPFRVSCPSSCRPSAPRGRVRVSASISPSQDCCSFALPSTITMFAVGMLAGRLNHLGRRTKGPDRGRPAWSGRGCR